VPTARLQSTDTPLCQRFDVALLDLDGVVYVGPDAVPTAPAALRAAREGGMRLAFVTNNAARPPSAVAEHLAELGIPAEACDVVTSAQAAAHYLAERLPAGSRVLVVGTIGLEQALAERGLVAVDTADDEPAAVVQGYSPDLSWRQLAEGAVAIRRGVPWVATNLDPTVPSPRGPLPGNGSLVAALRLATGVDPVSTGKPDPTMHRETVERSGAERPLVVGDRLDTDIEGANAVGCASLLVLSGVTTAADLLAAPPRLRPGFVAEDVSGLLRPAPEVAVSDGSVDCGRWRVLLGDGSVRLTEAGPGSSTVEADDAVDALRALAVACWSMADAAPGGADRAASGASGPGNASDTNAAGTPVPSLAADSEAAEQALRRLNLNTSTGG
jgi:HAD superfamily hydrolase (TIGR01450 family)